MTVDIIIPCYYSAEIIQPCLEKIAKQTKINDITVTLVNDCSPNTDCDYWDLISKYLSRIHIKYFKTEKNSGPGVARQIGLDHATADWIMFIDDDDELYDETVIERLLSHANLEKVISVSGQSIHQRGMRDKGEIQRVTIHHHGSIYNRRLLEKIHARYDPRLSFLEEDGAFTRIIMFYGINYEQVKIEEPVYIKKFILNHISLTGTVNIAQRIVGLIGLNTVDTFYRSEVPQLQNHPRTESYFVISNLLYYLTTGDIQLNHEQYATLLSFINQFLPLCQNVDCNKFVAEDLNRILNFYNEHFHYDNFTFTFAPMHEFKTQYLEWLRIIFTKLKME